MQKPAPFRILILQPPCGFPSSPSWLVLHTASRLSTEGSQLFFYDANLDAHRISRWISPAEKDSTREDPSADDSTSPDAWSILKTEAFYRPESFVSASAALKAAGLECRKAVDFSIALGDRFARRIASIKPHLLVIVADSPIQAQTGFDMLHRVSHLQKDLPSILACGPEVQPFPGSFEEGVLPYEDFAVLPRFVPGLQILSGKDAAALPPLNLFRSEAYAAPDPVFHVKGLPETPSSYWDWLETLSKSGVKALCVNDPDPKMPMETDGSEQPGDISMPAVGLRMALTEEIPPELFSRLHRMGVRLIVWSRPSGPLKGIGKSLYQASKAGIWNHLVSENPDGLQNPLADFIAANPNLVHSWSGPFSAYALSDKPLPLPASPYDKITPLPGRPFWSFIADPLYLLLYLARYGTRTLLRWRIRADGSAYTLGDGIRYHYVKPQDLPVGFLDILCCMVEAGGSVDTTWVRYNLERAFLVGYAEEEGVIVGNSSLKNPRESYLKDLSQRTRFDLSGYLERGYTSVRPEYRGLGIGTTLLEGLTSRIGEKKLFSIIAEDNIATQKMALRNRTRKVGTFFSEKSGKAVGIWVPEWMLEQ